MKGPPLFNEEEAGGYLNSPTPSDQRFPLVLRRDPALVKLLAMLSVELKTPSSPSLPLALLPIPLDSSSTELLPDALLLPLCIDREMEVGAARVRLELRL